MEDGVGYDWACISQRYRGIDIVKGAVYLTSDPAGIHHADTRRKMKELEVFLRLRGQAFILGGDWNIPPEAMRDSGWPRRLNAIIYKPDTDFTCQNGERVLDYWLVSCNIFYGMSGINMDTGSPWRPHLGQSLGSAR